MKKRKSPRQELWDAIVHDFAGEQGQKIQHMLINDAPKYGNDNDDVDQLVVDAYASYIDEMKKYPNTRYGRGPIGGIRYAGTSSISANVGQGFGQWQTPDGMNMPKHHWLKDVHLLIVVIRCVQQLSLNQYQNYQPMKLQVVFY